MKYRHVGRSGLRVSALSLGSWVTFDGQLPLEAATACMKEAFDQGCIFFDNAEAYGHGRAETVMGEAFRELGWARSEYVVSTKLFWGGEGQNQRGLSRKHVIEGITGSLGRLGLSYVDILYCHRADKHVPIEETVRAINHVIDRGEALYWGTSEWSADAIREAIRVADTLGLMRPIVEQPQYHLFHRERVEREYTALCDDAGLGLTTWSPLASGLLTGKYNRGVPDASRLALPEYQWLRGRLLGDPQFPDKIQKLERLTKIAQELGGTLTQLAIAWCAANGQVSSVITGASRLEQVRENFGAVKLIDKLDTDALSRIDGILDNTPAQEPDWRAG